MSHGHVFPIHAGYPLFLLHRKFLRGSDVWIQHIYFALTGMFMAW